MTSSPESLQNHLYERKANECSKTGACTFWMAWGGINWTDFQRQVRRLQSRMVKAVQVGRHNRTKALQWLLTHSFSGRALAISRVTENKGGTPPDSCCDQRGKIETNDARASLAANEDRQAVFGVATTLLRSTPIPSISTSIISPGLIGPTPAGVPVMM